MASVEVFELASKENLFPEGYLAANPDVANSKMDPLVHFKNYGSKEHRRQFTRGFLVGPHWQERFEKFESSLDFDLNGATKFPISLSDKVHSLTTYLRESANKHPGFFDDVIRHNPDKLYMDLGCGLRQKMYTNCIYVEVYPSATSDIIVEPTCLYPFKSNTLDGVGCFAVLEHCRKPWTVVEEIYRMLKPGGIAYIDWPFLQAVHGYPNHYFNATREGMRTIFEDRGFDVRTISTGGNQGFDFTISFILGKLVQELPNSKYKTELMNMTVAEVVKLHPQQDLWKNLIATAPDAIQEKFACGNTMIAVKTD